MVGAIYYCATRQLITIDDGLMTTPFQRVAEARSIPNVLRSHKGDSMHTANVSAYKTSNLYARD